LRDRALGEALRKPAGAPFDLFPGEGEAGQGIAHGRASLAGGERVCGWTRARFRDIPTLTKLGRHPVGRPPIGKKAMTATERQRRHRERNVAARIAVLERALAVARQQVRLLKARLVEKGKRR